MLKNFFEKIKSQLFYLLGTGLFIAFFFLIVWGENGLLRLHEMQNIKSKIVQENEQRLLKNLYLSLEIKRLKTLPYVEQKSRSELGMITENETVFIVSED